MRKKRNYLIDPSFQLKLIASVLVPFFVALGFIYFKIGQTISVLKKTVVTLGFNDNPRMLELIGMNELTLKSYLGYAAGISSLIMILSVVLISHKMAGPIYRLKQYLKQSNQNDSSAIEPISFREGDYLKDIEEDLNQYVIKPGNRKNKKSA